MSRRFPYRTIAVIIAALFILLWPILRFQQNVDSVRRDPLAWDDVSVSNNFDDHRGIRNGTFPTMSADITTDITSPPALATVGRGVITEPSKSTRNTSTNKYTSATKAADGPPASTKIDEPSKLPNHSNSSRYAYAFAIWRLYPEKPSYKGYLANILIATRLLRLHGSTSDVVVIIKLHYNSSHQALPIDDLQLLEGMKIRVHYLPKDQNDRHLNIYGTMFHKFTVFNLTEYRQVMYLDSDFMPLNNLDYLMEQADHGFLKPTIIVASNREPSNGGMMVVRPNSTVYQDIQRIIKERGPLLGNRNRKGWDEVLGWGHAIQPPDAWETNAAKNTGTLWNFWAANADQGFLYHYCKYVLKDCTQILARKVINFGPSTNNNATEVPTTMTLIKQQWNITSTRNSFWTNVAPKDAYDFMPDACARLTSSSSPNWPGCLPPYRHFRHFTGGSKPWQQKAPKILRRREAHSTQYLWWHTLVELRTEEGLNNTSSLHPIQLPY